MFHGLELFHVGQGEIRRLVFPLSPFGDVEPKGNAHLIFLWLPLVAKNSPREFVDGLLVLGSRANHEFDPQTNLLGHGTNGPSELAVG